MDSGLLASLGPGMTREGHTMSEVSEAIEKAKEGEGAAEIQAQVIARRLLDGSN
jgi:hypothetical protein